MIAAYAVPLRNLLMTESNLTPFVAFLVELQERRGINPNQIAAFAGVSASTVGNWLRGSEPKPESLKKLAKALGMPYRALRDVAYPAEDDAPMDRTQVYDEAARDWERLERDAREFFRRHRPGPQPSP